MANEAAMRWFVQVLARDALLDVDWRRLFALDGDIVVRLPLHRCLALGSKPDHLMLLVRGKDSSSVLVMVVLHPLR